MDVQNLTIAGARIGLHKKEFSALELTKACLKIIAEKNPDMNAFITVTEDDAHHAAKVADELLQKGEASVLTGIPFGVKDAICTADVRATGAARILDTYIPPFDATVVRKIKEAGAVLVGKQNCDSFGHGASNENSMYGAVKNPHDTSRVSGGSSGGSAAALAANMCLFSIAEDTGGSIRQPAAFCGVVGFRPSYGRNSRYGIMPMASSLDTVGPMAKTVEDIALLMEIMAGVDPLDATTAPHNVPTYTEEIQKPVKGMRIGVPQEYFELEGLESETKMIVDGAIQKLKDLGCVVVPVSLPHTKYAVPTYYLLVPSEDSSNLGRLDGIRYGVREAGDALEAVYANSRSHGFPSEVKRRIMIGTYALSAGYYDAYYKKAQKVRSLIAKDFADVFTEVDAIITPTSPFPAFRLGEKSSDVLSMYLADVFVSPAALAGVPALSIPGGKTKNGLPVGVQLIGPRLQDEQVLRVGHALFSSIHS